MRKYFCTGCQEELCPENHPQQGPDGLLYCLECANELFRGKIGPPPRPTAPFGYYGPRDETGPAYDDAIRAMEDGRG